MGHSCLEVRGEGGWSDIGDQFRWGWARSKASPSPPPNNWRSERLLRLPCGVPAWIEPDYLTQQGLNSVNTVNLMGSVRFKPTRRQRYWSMDGSRWFFEIEWRRALRSNPIRRLTFSLVHRLDEIRVPDTHKARVLVRMPSSSVSYPIPRNQTERFPGKGRGESPVRPPLPPPVQVRNPTSRCETTFPERAWWRLVDS